MLYDKFDFQTWIFSLKKPLFPVSITLFFLKNLILTCLMIFSAHVSIRKVSTKVGKKNGVCLIDLHSHTELMIIHGIIIFAPQTRSMLLILIKHLVFQKLSLQISCRVLRYAGCVSIIYKARRARTTPPTV
jgi:hypothetical protein